MLCRRGREQLTNLRRPPPYIPASLRRLWGPNLLLAALLLAALALRLYGIDWDGGQGFHPDERSFYLRADDMFRTLTLAPGYERWAAEWPGMEAGIPDFWTALSAERSPLNPHWFPLGSALIYALVLVRSIAEPFTDWGAMDWRFVGRGLAALADTASVGMMYVLGRRMYGTGAGLAAAAGTAFAVIHIQHAHFYRPEPFSVLASLGALWAMLRLIDGGRRRDALLLGALTGLTLATKIAAAPIILPLLLAFLWVAKDRAGGDWRSLTPGAAARVLPLAALTGAAALAVFFITTPYALLDWPAFVEDIGAEAEMARTAGHWPFTWQYADAPAFWYQIRQTAVWGLGLPLGIAVWLAAPFTAWLAWRGGLTQRADWLLLAWAVPAFVFLELFEVKFLRYVFPLLPFYILMAARMLTAGVAWAAGRQARADKGGGGATDFIPEDAPFSEEWHGTPPLVGDEELFDEPLAGDGDISFATDFISGDAPFAEEWHATPPLAGTVAAGPARAIPGGGTGTWRAGLSRLVDRWAYPAAVGILAMVLGATALYALAFASIYGRPHTAIAAAEWLNANAPAGASIVNAGSLWDERIPDLGGYEVWEFPAYHRPDDGAKVGELAERMAGAEYLIFYSNRAYGAIARLPEEFPRSAAFYRQLFQGELGYRLERGFTSYPSLAGAALRDNPYRRAGLTAPAVAPGGDDGQPGGIVIDLGYADENVIGYDHPQALVFRNVEGLTADALRQRIDAGVASTEETPALMLSPAARAAQQSGGTWSEVFSRDGWGGSRWPWLTWLLAVELIGLAAFPLTWWLLRPLPDRGVLFARIAGLLLVAWVVWMLVSAGLLRYSTGAIGLGLLAVAVPSAVVVWRQWRELWQWLRGKWRLAVTGEALFLLAYLAFALIRAANPDLWHPWRGGEKPMELAYFTAVARSSVMPPYDPWFSGGYLNYYYWGYFILSVPARLTGTAPATAFNLAVPLLFALTATGAGSLAYNMVAAARRGRSDGGAAASGRAWRRWRPGAAVVAGLLGAGMAAVAGNLDGLAQLLQMARARVQGMAAPLSEFDFWRSSRAIPELEEIEPTWLTPWIERRDWMESGFHITEFPYFTFLFADLHAHMMTMPFALLGLALGFALLAGLPALGWRCWQTWGTTAVLGLAVGSLWAINSWEYPAYALLAVGIIAAAAGLTPGGARTRLATAVGLAGLMLAVGYAAFLPFYAAMETFGTGIEATRWRTPLFNYLLIHALPLLAAYALLAATLPEAARPLLCRIRGGAHLPAAQQWLLAGVAAGILLAIYCGVAGYATAGCLAALLTLTAWAVAGRLAYGGDDAGRLTSEGCDTARQSDIMALGMLGMALAIGIGVEFVRVEGDIGRMNTVFKYYLVAWLLFAGAGAYGFWRGWTASRSILMRWVVGGMAGVVAAGVLVYPALATPVRIADRFGPTPLTLDGAAWMDEAQYRIYESWCGVEGDAPVELIRDAEAMRWLQDKVTGTPVILEAHGNQYCWNGRMSAYTGLPTVLGWEWHQTQQRGDDAAIQARADDVATLYNTTDLARTRRLLDQYGIAYIVVGELEQAFYDGAGITKFETLADRGALTLEYANEGTRIYRVN